MKQTLFFCAAIALSTSAGCSLSRSVLGAPADGGIDAGERDAWVARDAPDAYVEIDAFTLDVGPDASIDGSLDAGLDGGLDASVDAATDTGCMSGARMCNGSDVWQCDPDGVFRSHQVCTHGCLDMPATHCEQLRATHVMNEALLPQGSTPLHVSAGQTVQIDSSSGAITLMPSTVIRPAGASSPGGAIGFATQTGVAPSPGLAIFTFSTITIDAGGTLVGMGGNALVLLASGDVVIDGVIDVGANGTVGGPGGFAGGGHRADGSGPSHGSRGGLSGLFDDFQGGGGGGGHAGTGGKGGADSPFCCGSADGGDGGAVTGDASGSPLIGGSGGGGGTNDSSGGVGGGGGGAIQITSLTTIQVGSSAVIRAPGAGGGHGDQAGGGGGAGGAVFLEAITIDFQGIIAVNGGGGGGGGGGGAHDGSRGTDMVAPTPAGAGNGGGGDGGGGAGGASLSGGTGGEGNGGGGGGGGGGRITFVTMAGGYVPVGMVTPPGGVSTAAATIR